MKFLNTHTSRNLTFTLNNNGVSTDVNIAPGASVDLPEDNEHVKTLVAKGMLEKDVTPAPVVATKAADKKD